MPPGGTKDTTACKIVGLTGEVDVAVGNRLSILYLSPTLPTVQTESRGHRTHVSIPISTPNGALIQDNMGSMGTPKVFHVRPRELSVGANDHPY